MTRCPACQSGIDPKATICPWCQQRLGFRRDRLVGVLLGLAIGGAFIYAGTRDPSEDAKLLVKVHQACEAQTGQHCD